ncbi:hypothetical protein CB1_001232005 [Camelus ferus]|nr:hypothetical protein CB1_001232005 [Camelus ferus]
MKARAPPPPGKPASPDVHGGWKPSRDVSPGPQQKVLNMREDLGRRVVDITVVLPSGLEKETVVNGSHAMMDLLVELCLQNHLNPSTHALEIRSSENQQPLSFKPNTLVGTLNVHTVFLKEKVPEAKVKAGPPKVPEGSSPWDPSNAPQKMKRQTQVLVVDTPSIWTTLDRNQL